MAGPAWLIDSRRIASKIKNASETVGSSRSRWMSNPTKACPRCKHIIDNSDVLQEWPGLPRGVKFDPSDQELLWHLLTKVGKGDGKSHPFIDEFIPTVDEDDGICYTHPQKLPGVKQDGSVSHFFHRTFKAYNTGTRKRRKIHSNDLGDVRWHKTGKTKPVIIDGKHLGCKKIMVLYLSLMKGGKPEKTNWVMHQYHLGTGEDEHEGEFVVSKVFYQQQLKPSDKGVNLETLEIVTPQVDLIAGSDLVVAEHHLRSSIQPLEVVTPQVDPVAGSDLMVAEHHLCRSTQTSDQVNLYYGSRDEDTGAHPELEKLGDHDTRDQSSIDNPGLEKPSNKDIDPTEDTKLWEGESLFLLNSQQLAEEMDVLAVFLHSQSSCADDEEEKSKNCLSEYKRLPAEDLKKDLEACRGMDAHDNANIELDTLPERGLSQLEFGSQDSSMAWAGSKLAETSDCRTVIMPWAVSELAD